MVLRPNVVMKPDRSSSMALAHQTCDNIRTVIEDGRLEVGARLSSVCDLAI